MARNIVKAKLDIIFKKLFTDEGNQHLLQAYLSDTLGIPYDSIENPVVLKRFSRTYSKYHMSR